MDENAVDPNNERGKIINQGDLMEICQKVNDTWHRYIEEGKITPNQFNPNND